MTTGSKLISKKSMGERTWAVDEARFRGGCCGGRRESIIPGETISTSTIGLWLLVSAYIGIFTGSAKIVK